MQTTKKLNLNKYAFLNHLKGDVFNWLTCEANYQKIAKENKLLEDLTPWRFNDEKNDEENSEEIRLNKELPDQIVAGIDIGNFAMEWAKASYPDHEPVIIDKYSNIENVEYTKQQLNTNDDLILFEATFGYNDFFIRTDILIKTGNNLKIIEVKAVTAPKEIHAWDLFFQKTLIEKSNSKLKPEYTLLMIDSHYLHSPKFSPKQKALKLFVETPLYLKTKAKPAKSKKTGNSWTIQNQLGFAGFGIYPYYEDIPVTKSWGLFSDFFEEIDKVNIRENFDKTLQDIKNVQLLDNPPLTGMELKNWDYMKSDYMPWFLKINGVNEKDSIFDFRYFKIASKLELYNSGIKTIQEAPLSKITPKKLDIPSSDDNDTNKYIRAFLESEPGKLKFKTIIQKHFVDEDKPLMHKEGLKRELAKYKNGPIYMYDFETANLANPLVENTRPYQQVPYQFSVHVITDPNDFDFQTMKNIKHYEWLAEERDKFPKTFWVEFANIFLENGEGVYVSWNMSFEKTRIMEMDDEYLNSEQFEILQKVHDETVDLEDPFKYKFYYHKELHGSSSIKAVGPHFASEINYKNLNNVHKGDESANVAKKWIRERNNDSDLFWKMMRKDMLKYCEYDTLLMVAILQRLKEKVND